MSVESRTGRLSKARLSLVLLEVEEEPRLMLEFEAAFLAVAFPTGDEKGTSLILTEPGLGNSLAGCRELLGPLKRV
jgi:hypothetical protein